MRYIWPKSVQTSGGSDYWGPDKRLTVEILLLLLLKINCNNTKITA